jgi:hypothetical protein
VLPPKIWLLIVEHATDRFADLKVILRLRSTSRLLDALLRDRVRVDPAEGPCLGFTCPAEVRLRDRTTKRYFAVPPDEAYQVSRRPTFAGPGRWVFPTYVFFRHETESADRTLCSVFGEGQMPADQRLDPAAPYPIVRLLAAIGPGPLAGPSETWHILVRWKTAPTRRALVQPSARRASSLGPR